MNDRKAIGIDLGGTRCRVAVITAAAALERRSEFADTATSTPAQLVERLHAAIGELAGGEESDDCGHLPVGLAMPGFFDPTTTHVRMAANLPKLVGSPFAAMLRRAIDRTVRVDGDCHAAARAEATHGAGRGVSRLLVVSIGTGIGASMMIDGRIVRHTRGGAGSLGHVVVDPEGPMCKCGQRGCLEAIAAGPAIDANGIEPAARALALGIATWHAVYQPARIVFCGGVAAMGDKLLAPLRAALAERSPHVAKIVDLSIGRFTADAALIGAGLMALETTRLKTSSPVPAS